MANLQTAINKFLTLALLSAVFMIQIAFVFGDLAPKEDEDDEVKPPTDLKKIDEIVTTLQPPKTSLGFIHAFIASFSVIMVSEIGDKTFFIAAIMSMKYPRLTVFAGAISALALMTVLSAVFGMVFIKFIPPHITRWVSVLLFVVFGLKMLHEGWNMTATDAAEEMEEVQHDIRRREDEIRLKYINKDHRHEGEDSSEEDPNTLTQLTTDIRSANADRNMANKEANKVVQDPEAGGAKKAKAGAFKVLLRIFVQAFTMTFVAEWGDRSQITTIILSARENLMGVITGGIIGHAICTGLGVLGGRMIAQKISVRTVTLIGGVVFILFAITSSIWDPNEAPPPSAETTGGN